MLESCKKWTSRFNYFQKFEFPDDQSHDKLT